MAKVWHSIRNAFKAIRDGELLLRLRADKFYIHILYLFLLMWVSILLSLQVDKTLARVGDNKAALEELRIQHAQKEAALVKLHSASSAQKRLRELGSAATLPTEPATVIRHK